jgi:hypothetical protein
LYDHLAGLSEHLKAWNAKRHSILSNLVESRLIEPHLYTKLILLDPGIRRISDLPLIVPVRPSLDRYPVMFSLKQPVKQALRIVHILVVQNNKRPWPIVRSLREARRGFHPGPELIDTRFVRGCRCPAEVLHELKFRVEGWVEERNCWWVLVAIYDLFLAAIYLLFVVLFLVLVLGLARLRLRRVEVEVRVEDDELAELLPDFDEGKEPLCGDGEELLATSGFGTDFGPFFDAIVSEEESRGREAGKENGSGKSDAFPGAMGVKRCGRRGRSGEEGRRRSRRVPRERMVHGSEGFGRDRG